MVLHAAGRGRFTVTLPDGTPLATRPTHSPIYAACRALIALGFTDGPAHFRHVGSPHSHDAEVRSIHAAAQLTTVEEDRRGLRTVKWVPFDSGSPRAHSATCIPLEHSPPKIEATTPT